MNTLLDTMISKYKVDNELEKKNAIKEVLQEIILCALSKANFFKNAAFYGGTALRIFYGLDRFSEDLDFSLVVKDESFQLERYFGELENIVNSFGLSVTLETKEKEVNSSIKSAFLKANTIEHFLHFYPDDTIKSINKNEKIKIKFEVDTSPSDYSTYETKFKLLPIPYSVKVFDMPSLFAGKIHAIICRTRKNRVKGRDLYDYIFYLSNDAKYNLAYLTAKLIDSHFIEPGTSLTNESVHKILIEKFNHIDFEEAKEDIIPFIKDIRCLDTWSKEFFVEITKNLLNSN